jgi:predicted nucleotidyltransferase
MFDSTYLEQRLLNATKTHNVHPLHACESGSRAWGLASTDSDYDLRFIYRHPREWYLSLHPGRDMIGPVMENDGELDMVGWDVRKFLFHLASSNPSVLEWLNSPIHYYQEGSFLSDCQRLADDCFRPRKAIAHYLGIAHGARQSGLGEDNLWNLKKFCYWMRPILAATYVARHESRPPITMEALLPLLEDRDLLSAVEELMQLKATVKEDHRLRIDSHLMTHLMEMKTRATAACNGMDKVQPDAQAADAFFRQTIGWI